MSRDLWFFIVVILDRHASLAKTGDTALTAGVAHGYEGKCLAGVYLRRVTRDLDVSVVATTGLLRFARKDEGVSAVTGANA